MKTHLGVGKTESAMKKFMTVSSVVLMAAGFVSCKKEINVYGPAPEKGELKVRFIADASLTKVGLTPDENDENFSAVWDKDDHIGIVCTDKNDSKVSKDEILACWVPSGDKSTPGYFETFLDATSLTEGNAPYSFVGYWPQGIKVADLFPSSRMQNGDKYNGNYDIMISDKTAVDFSVTESNAVTVVLPMKRQTSIAYFHIKSELNEKIVSATLTTGEGEFIAASNANLSGDGFSIVDGCGKNSITLHIEGDMYSSDFKLWFNVLPVNYTSMKLVVETENHSFTMSKKAAGSWKAGELNSVVIGNVPADKWAEIERPSADKAITLTMVKGTLDTYKSEDDVVTAAFANNGGTSIAWNSNNSELRLYPKGTLTITAKTGSSLKNIKYTANINAGGSNNNIKPTVKINNVETTNLEWTGNSETVTLAVSGPAGNVGFKSIEITYTDPNAISDPIYKYSVTCQDVKNGTIQISPASAKVGETVLLTPQPNEGYEYLEGSLKAFNTVTEKEIPIDAENKFEMPAANVTVTASFSAKPQYSIAVQTPVGGTLTADKESAWEGADVNVTATAAEKYAFKEWNVTWGDKGETVSVADNKFTMPAGNVNVSATFIPTLTVTPMNPTTKSSMAGYHPFTVETVATDWMVSVPEEDTWVSITKKESGFDIAYTANELETGTTLERSTTITVSSEQAEKTGDNAIKIKFSQSGKEYIKPDVSYNLVKSVNELYEGMVFVIGCGTKKVAAGAMGDNVYLSKVDANITEGVLSSNSALEFTLGKSGSNWTLTSSEGVLGANAEKKLLKNAGTTTWNISIDASSKNASIKSTVSSYGTIFYNSGSPRFLNYTSKQTAVQIYALENREAQSILYSGNTGSIDIYTNEQNLPTLDQSGVKTSVKYDSSDETIATIDKNGTITALKAGTTTITATAVASAYYKPASTSFTLTVTDSTPYLTATASKTSVAATGETVTITVDTNVESWKATSDNADFVVGTPSGNTVDVVVSKNTDASERTATITVRAGSLSETITLTQKSYESYENSGTLASWSFTSSSYPANKTNYANNGSDDLATGTFYLNGTGSTWNKTKGLYAFTAVTDITITVKATNALKQGSKITFSMDTYYNKTTNAPMKGFNLTVAEGDATASKTGLSVTSFSLSTSTANKSVDYTLQNDVSAGSTVKLILTQTGKAGTGEGYINNIKAKYIANGLPSVGGDGGE